MTPPFTEQSVADWMLSEIERNGDLYQDSAVVDIAAKFGDAFTHENDSGNMAISKGVLQAFRKKTKDSVVWERSERRWRKREATDAPGRQQN